jgi:YVTN family beta-propeller protein
MIWKGLRRIRSPLSWAALPIALILGLAAPATASAARALYVSSTVGTVSAFSINADGSLSSRGVPGTGGTLTEGLAISPDAKYLYIANFTTNSVAGFQIFPAGNIGALPNSPFTTGFSTPLGVAPDPGGGHLFAWNHGDEIAASTINADGSLTNITGSPFTVPGAPTNPFAGSVAPDGDHLYVPNENNNPAAAPETVTAYSVAANGAVSFLQNIASGNPAVQSNPFGSAITPDGDFLYVSNPEDGANGTISGFQVNANGTLTTVDVSPGIPFAWRDAAPGNHPLNMAVSPDGNHLYVATRASNTVNAYTINGDGSLTPVPGQPFPTGGLNGKALALTPDGNRLYVSNNGSNNVSGFDVAGNGALTLISGSPFGLGDIPASPDLESIAITPDQPPTASFAAQAALAGNPTSFDASGSSDTDGNPATYVWDFGDGSGVTEHDPNVNHTYAQPGTYTVSLTLTDNEGCSTGRIFTGKATLCNGSGVADTSQQVSIAAPKCQGKTATVIGTSGSDNLKGTNKADVIAGQDGDDKISGRGGKDRVCGGNGKDTASGGTGNDRLNGNNGKDKLKGNAGKDILKGGKGKDTLIGGPGKDKLKGGPGKDTQTQ